VTAKKIQKSLKILNWWTLKTIRSLKNNSLKWCPDIKKKGEKKNMLKSANSELFDHDPKICFPELKLSLSNTNLGFFSAKLSPTLTNYIN
jgi:hypothetical protein